MRRQILHIAVFLLVVFFSTACREENRPANQGPAKPAGESLIKANRYLVKQEKEEIENYIRRHGWQMNETGSGLRYFIIENGRGEAVEKGNVVFMKFSCRLITGDLIYSSSESGLKSFVVGHGGVESGLEEIALLLHRGDKARVIIPAHLAFGLLGDDNKIPPHATLVYEIELIEIN